MQSTWTETVRQFSSRKIMCPERRRRLSETLLYDLIKKNKALTFDNLYDVKKDSKLKDKQSILKIDRTVLQRLIASYAESTLYLKDTETILLRHQLIKGEQRRSNQLDFSSKVEMFFYHWSGIISLLYQRTRLIWPCSCSTNL